MDAQRIEELLRKLNEGLVERVRTSEGTKYNPYITAEEVAEWERVEKEGLFLENSVP